MIYTIESYVLDDEKYLSKFDGLPIKNKLPKDLKSRLKTMYGWAELGKSPKDNAPYYRFHSWKDDDALHYYYLDTDVEDDECAVPYKDRGGINVTNFYDINTPNSCPIKGTNFYIYKDRIECVLSEPMTKWGRSLIKKNNFLGWKFHKGAWILICFTEKCHNVDVTGSSFEDYDESVIGKLRFMVRFIEDYGTGGDFFTFEVLDGKISNIPNIAKDWWNEWQVWYDEYFSDETVADKYKE